VYFSEDCVAATLHMDRRPKTLFTNLALGTSLETSAFRVSICLIAYFVPSASPFHFGLLSIIPWPLLSAFSAFEYHHSSLVPPICAFNSTSYVLTGRAVPTNLFHDDLISVFHTLWEHTYVGK
jgi:hypothetical protein